MDHDRTAGPEGPPPVRGGADVDAFVAGSWPRLYRTAYLMTGNAQDAEDAVQSALATVVERWSTIRRTDDPGVYARRVLATGTYRRTGRRRMERQRLLLVGRREQTRATVGDPTDDLARRDALCTALQALPPRMRASVVLRFYADLSEREVAEVLGCSVGTVKSQTAKALARLRTDVDEEAAR